MESEQEKKILASLDEEVAFWWAGSKMMVWNYSALICTTINRGTCLCCDVSSSTKVASLLHGTLLTPSVDYGPTVRNAPAAAQRCCTTA